MMNITKGFKDALAIFKKYYVELILGYLVTVIVSCVTLGILAPVIFTGYMLMILKAKRKKKISLNDLFFPMNKFFSLLGLYLLCGLLITLSFILIIPPIFLAAWWMFAAIILIDKKLSVFKAMKKSRDMVRSKNVWMHILLLILVSVISSLGCSLAGVGMFITVPFAIAAFVSIYDDESKSKRK